MTTWILGWIGDSVCVCVCVCVAIFGIISLFCAGADMYVCVWGGGYLHRLTFLIGQLADDVFLMFY